LRIIGIDPGIANCGYGIIEKNNQILTALDYGVIKTSSKDSLEFRLSVIYESLDQLIKKYQPTLAGVEEIYFTSSRNKSSAMPVAHAKGVIMLCLSQNLVKQQIFNPLDIKKAIVGIGKADKNQVSEMVRFLLKIEEITSNPLSKHKALKIMAFNKKLIKL